MRIVRSLCSIGFKICFVRIEEALPRNEFFKREKYIFLQKKRILFHLMREIEHDK